MRRLILAGVHQGLVSRNREYRPQFEGWQLIRCDSGNKKRAVLDGCWKQALTLAGELNHDGAHIFAFHYVQDEYPLYEAQVSGRFRLVWLDLRLLQCFGQPVFTDYLKSLLDGEEQWCATVKPSNHRSPLVLPECSFRPEKGYTDMWKRAQIACTSQECSRVGQIIRGFRKRHYLKGGWVDAGQMRFSTPPAREYHGIHVPEERRWKFALRLPAGFHFHVGCGGPFHLPDGEGCLRSFTRYANIDPHGFVLGGK